jgi:hypothetical protein
VAILLKIKVSTFFVLENSLNELSDFLLLRDPIFMIHILALFFHIKALHAPFGTKPTSTFRVATTAQRTRLYCGCLFTETQRFDGRSPL